MVAEVRSGGRVWGGDRRGYFGTGGGLVENVTECKCVGDQVLEEMVLRSGNYAGSNTITWAVHHSLRILRSAWLYTTSCGTDLSRPIGLLRYHPG